MKTPKLTIKGVTVQTEYEPSMYGFDIEDKMITTLSEELARNIDRIFKMFKMKKNQKYFKRIRN